MSNVNTFFLPDSTHFAYGINGGINQLPALPLPLGLGNTFKYTGRGEYDLTFDLEKFAGMPKGTVLLRMEHWYGEYGNVSLRTGSLTPAVFPAMLPPAPDNPGDLFMTDVTV